MAKQRKIKPTSMVWPHFRSKAKLAKPRTEEVRMLPSDHANNITLRAALWGIIGAKLFHWLENPDEFLRFVQNPSGDMIFSGTPGGVGVFRKPPMFLKGGDEVVVHIDGLGSLTNRVALVTRAKL